MNSFLFSAIALCLISGAQCSYQQQQQQQQSAYGSSAGVYNQRKMAPSPQTYGSPLGGQAANQEQQYAEMAPTSHDNSAQQYQQQAADYGQQQQASYGAKQSAASYERPSAAAGAYARPAAKYEEPYQAPMPFAWGYDINDGYGGAQYHKESGDEYGKRTGSYGYTDAYGVYRQVDYVADENGFRATIKTNEPGTANESPADVELHAYEPPSNYYAGNRDSSYGKQASGYGQQQQQQQSYSAPAVSQQSYSAPAARAGYATSRGSSAAAARPQAYDSGAQYSSSAIVPVYQRAPAAKRNY